MREKAEIHAAEQSAPTEQPTEEHPDQSAEEKK
jgi:hypothetical protein